MMAIQRGGLFRNALKLARIWGQTPLIQEVNNYSGPRTGATRYNSCILLNLTEPQCPHLQNGKTVAPTSKTADHAGECP